MTEVLLDEEEYLIDYAIKAFNTKFSVRVDPSDCGIISIQPSYGYKLGYSVTTVVGEDFVEIHLYVTPAKVSRVDIVRMEVIQNLAIQNAPGDEVYVVTGEISHYGYRYAFQALEVYDSGDDLVYYMDENYATLSDGTPLIWS